jgi:chromosome segregation ATPase
MTDAFMGRLAGLILFAAAVASAQDQLTTLQQAAAKTTADWDAVAGSLEARVARMLPCDKRVRAAIDEVSQASDARLAALSRYLQAASAQARKDAEAARAALADHEKNAHEIEAERTEPQQDLTAVEAQLADLVESAKRRAALDGAQKKLEAIAAAARQRVEAEDQQAGRFAALSASLRELAAAYDSRQKAVEGEISALAIETTRWSDFYAARFARAQTECSITNAAPARPRKKK